MDKLTIYFEVNVSKISLNWICSYLCEWFWFVTYDPNIRTLSRFVYLSAVFIQYDVVLLCWKRCAYVHSYCLFLEQPVYQRLIEFLDMNVILLQRNESLSNWEVSAFAPRYFNLIAYFMFSWAMCIACFCCAFWCADVHMYFLCVYFYTDLITGSNRASADEFNSFFAGKWIISILWSILTHNNGVFRCIHIPVLNIC
jgi:hypothetical protein